MQQLVFQRGYITAPLSIWKNIEKVMPGSVVEVISVKKNYELKKNIPIGQRLIQPFPDDNLMKTSLQEGKIKLNQMLTDVIKSQSLSDVPLGVFLSGGIDSSIVTSIMQKHSSAKVKTFSIGFSEKQYDESSYAKAIADHLGTDHTSFTVTPKDTINLIPEIPKIYSDLLLLIKFQQLTLKIG